MRKLLLCLALLGCGNATEPSDLKLAATAAVVLTPATVAAHVGDRDTVVGTASCLLAWRNLDSTKINLISTFKGPGQTKANSAVVQSLAVGTAGLRAGCSGAADTSVFTIAAVQDTIGVQAAAADALVRTLSVQLHLGQGGIYDQFASIVKPRVLELGVRHVRERMFDQTDTQAQQQELAAAGIKLTAGCWPEGTDYADASHCIAMANAYGTGTIDAFDGWNEVNGKPIADWESAWVQWQQTMWNAYGANATWSGLPVLANSFTSTSATNQLFADKGSQSNKVDAGNMHSYPGGGSTPEGSIDSWLSAQSQLTGPKPNWVTETGYHTCRPDCPNGTGVSELAQAKYLGRLPFAYWNRNIGRTSIYELLDEGPASDSTDTRENHWGMVRFDGSVKPSFTTLKNVIALLTDQGAVFTPGKLNYTLTGALSTTNTALFQKANGKFYLVIWQALNVYDTSAEADRVNVADAVTLTLGQTRTVNTYLPRAGLTPTPKGTGTSFVVNVPDEVLVVEVS
jgi:hypothetical protein